MHPSQPPDATVEEIREQCERIQATWNPAETRRRIVGPKPAWRPAVIRDDFEHATREPLRDA